MTRKDTLYVYTWPLKQHGEGWQLVFMKRLLLVCLFSIALTALRTMTRPCFFQLSPGNIQHEVFFVLARFMELHIMTH